MLMYKPSVIDPPSDRMPEKAPRWDLTRTEACSSGKSMLGGSLLVSEFWRIYRAGIRSTEETWGPQGTWRAYPLGAPRCLVAHSFAFWSHPEASRVSYVQKKIIKKFCGIWTSFGTNFLETKNGQKIGTGTWH